MQNDLSNHQESQERFRYLRDHSGAEIQALDRQIKDARQRLDDNWHKIKDAKKRRLPYKRINELHRQRKAIINELHTARNNRNTIKSEIESARKDRENTGRNHVINSKRYYATIFSGIR